MPMLSVVLPDDLCAADKNSEAMSGFLRRQRLRQYRQYAQHQQREQQRGGEAADAEQQFPQARRVGVVDAVVKTAS